MYNHNNSFTCDVSIDDRHSRSVQGYEWDEGDEGEPEGGEAPPEKPEK